MPHPRPLARARREVSAGGVVVKQTGGNPVFSLIRANRRWGFPKGNIEKGETPAVTALREIAEETGLPLGQLRIVRPLPRVEYAFRWDGVLRFKIVPKYLVELQGEADFHPQLAEIEEARWFAAAAARHALSFKNSRKTLDAAIASAQSLKVAS